MCVCVCEHTVPHDVCGGVTNVLCVCVNSYRVCEFLYEKRREYHNILLCYIKDPFRQVSDT